MKNAEISKIFRNTAGMLEILGDNVFRIRSYERAAINIGTLSEDIAGLARDGKLRDIPGIGHDLSEKIEEYLKTGKIKSYEDLKKKIPEGLLALLEIPTVGPKTARLLYDKFHIKNIAALDRLIQTGKLKGVTGIKQKTIDNILKGIALVKKAREQMTLPQAEAAAIPIIDGLSKHPAVQKAVIAGSLRRQKETVRDIDILVVSSKPRIVMDAFCALPQVSDVIAKGPTKSSIRTREGSQVDCRAVARKSFGSSLVYFTGSKSFNIKLRALAIKNGLKVSEYGVFRKNKFICGATEEEVFAVLGMSYIEPEMREDAGEIELALKNKLPRLVEQKDIRGELHAHSDWTDGMNSIAEMADAAKKMGYSYIAITDHSQGLAVAGGLKPADLKRKKKEIDRLNARIKGIRVLFGTEVEIGLEGGIDYPDEILKEFDIVVGAIHSGFRQSRRQLTKRAVSACKNKYVHILAHPTGRLWGTRDAYDIDLDEVYKATKDTNTALEINSFPDRLDLNGANCRRAKELGARIAINTDSHNVTHLPLIRFGVSMARRGWLEAKDVINTLPLDKLLKAIRK